MPFQTVRLELTGICDMRCLYCHAGEKNQACNVSQELSHERWLQLIKESKNLGVTEFILTGGEPFLYSRWPEIVMACGENTKVIIATNGRHFTDGNLEVLKSLPQVNEFRMSLDGLATNDLIREGSSFKATLATIAKVQKYLPGRKVMIQTVVYRQNLSEVMRLYELLKDLGIYRWRLSQLWKTIRTEKNKGIVDFSDYDVMFALYAEVISAHQRDGKPFMFSIDNVYFSWIDKEDYAPMSLSGHPCAYNFDHLCINANGDIIFCPSLNVPMASVAEHSIATAVGNSKWLQDFKSITVGSLGCDTCRYIRICGGGCRADAKRWMKETGSVDPNSCCMMPRIEKFILPLLGAGEQAAFRSLIDERGSFPRITGSNIEEAVGSQ